MRATRQLPPGAIYRSIAMRGSRRLAWLAAVGAVVLGGLGVWRAVEPDRLGATPIGVRDGYVAPGASVSVSSDVPAVTRLRPTLRRAVRHAVRDARHDGIVLRLNSGWRSARYQRELLDRAAVTYGSRAAARAYVLPPGRSAHVHGAAVDVGPLDAALWLGQHGSRYGLCQTYAAASLARSPGWLC